MMNVHGFSPVKFGVEPELTKETAINLICNGLEKNGYNFPVFITQGSLYSIPMGVRYNWPTLPEEANGPKAIKIYVGNNAMATQLKESLKKMNARPDQNNPNVFGYTQGYKIWVVTGESAGPMVPTPPIKK